MINKKRNPDKKKRKFPKDVFQLIELRAKESENDFGERTITTQELAQKLNDLIEYVATLKKRSNSK